MAKKNKKIRRIKVGGNYYTIKLVDREDIGDERDAGECNSARLLIKIGKDMPQGAKESTLMHEILHAINITMEEKDVEFLAQALYAVLKDNKLITNWNFDD